MVALSLFLISSGIASAYTRWPLVGFDRQRTNYNPNETVIGSAQAGSLSLAWSTHVLSGLQGQAISGSPVIAHGTVFFASSIAPNGGTIYGLNETTGGMLWHYNDPNSGDTPDAYHRGMLYLTACCEYQGAGGLSTEAYAVSATGLTFKFSVYLDKADLLGGVLYGAYTVPYNGGYFLSAYSATTGSLIWSHNAPPTHPNWYWTDPVVTSGEILTSRSSSPSMTLQAYSPAGTLLWSVPDGGTPLVIDAALGITFTTCGSSLCAYSLSGGFLWKAANASGPVAVAGGSVFAACGLQHRSVCAYSEATGSRGWRSYSGGTQGLTGANGVIYVKAPHRVKALDATTGSHLGAIGWSRSPAVTTDGTVFLSLALALKAYRP